MNRDETSMDRCGTAVMARHGEEPTIDAAAGCTYADGMKLGWRDGIHQLVCIARHSGIRKRMRVNQ